MKENWIRWSFLLSGSFLALVLSGCSGAKPTGTVSGKVTMNGEPVTNGSVMLVSDDKTTGSTAELGTDGSFSLVEPLPIGKYIVCVTPPKLESADDPSLVKPTETAIPDKYHNELTSDITTEIKEGPNTVTVELQAGGGSAPSATTAP